VWGILGLFYAGGAMGPIVWGGVVASPFIGMIVGLLARRARTLGMSGKIVVSLLTLYCAIALFGLAAGIYDSTRDIPGRNVEVIWQSVLGALAGGTMLIILLWPLSMWNHIILWRLDEAR
jgi:hypothetical protein